MTKLDPVQGRIYQHLHAGGEVLTLIRSTLDHCALFADMYAITSRLKSATRMHSKIMDRQQKGNTLYTADSLTDTVGLRLITHYRDDIPDIVRRLFSLITAQTDINPNYFKNGILYEFLEYVPHLPAENDPFTAELREIYTSAYKGNPPKPFEIKPRGGYSSVHLVLQFRTPEIKDAFVGVEIQIRSVFEDAWGQIDHKLSYEQERRMGDVDPTQRESLKRHLSVLKGFLDTAADYADVIKSSFVSPPLAQDFMARSLDENNYIEALCKRAQISDSFEARILSLIEQKREVDKDIASGEDGAEEYVTIAEELSRLIQSDFEFLVDDLDDQLQAARASLRITLLLEAALCRLLSEDRQQVRLAVAQYRAIAKQQPDNPICWFRLGQALAFLATEAVPGSEAADLLVAEFSAAYDRTRQAIEKFERGETAPDVHVSTDEHSSIKANVAKLHGFALWRVSDLKRRIGKLQPADLSRICRAYEISANAIETAPSGDSRIRLINNALYFACDAHELHILHGLLALDELPSLEPLPSLLDELYAFCEKNQENAFRFWDTVAHACALLNRPIEGREAAAKVLDANAQIILPSSDFGNAYAAEMRTRAVQYAWQVYRESG